MANNTEIHDCSLPAYARAFGLALIVMIMVLGVIGNTVVLFVVGFLRRRHETVSYIFVSNVAASDLLTSLTVLPFDILYWHNFPVFPLAPNFCRLWNAFFFTFLAESSLSLCMMTFDVFLAIYRPLHYSMSMNPQRAYMFILGSWTWSITVGVLIYIYQEEPPEGEYLFDLASPAYGSYLILHIGFPSVVIPLFYLKVFLIAKSHASKIHSCEKDTKSKGKLSIRRQLALAKTFFLITVGFFVCWYPFFIVQLFYVFGWDASVDWCELETADTVVCWLAYVQCCLNPIFYAFRRKDVRHVLNHSLKRVDTIKNTITRQEPTCEKPEDDIELSMKK